MADSPSFSNAWLTADGDVINPDAPAGGGGRGYFKTPGALGQGGSLVDLPDPQSPAVRRLTPPDPDELQAATPNPPPATVPETFAVMGGSLQDARHNVDVKGAVLADLHTANVSNEIDTKLNPTGLTPVFPEYETEDKAPFKVVEEKTPFTLVGTATIQVVYPQGINASTTPPRWGRGTTDGDKQQLNTTVGFHESRHIADYKAWLTTQAIPTFKGVVGMTKAKYDAACDQFSREWNDYFRRAEADSERRTDEVGRKKSDVLAGR